MAITGSLSQIETQKTTIIDISDDPESLCGIRSAVIGATYPVPTTWNNECGRQFAALYPDEAKQISAMQWQVSAKQRKWLVQTLLRQMAAKKPAGIV